MQYQCAIQTIPEAKANAVLKEFTASTDGNAILDCEARARMMFVGFPPDAGVKAVRYALRRKGAAYSFHNGIVDMDRLAAEGRVVLTVTLDTSRAPQSPNIAGLRVSLGEGSELWAEGVRESHIRSHLRKVLPQGVRLRQIEGIAEDYLAAAARYRSKG